MSETASSYAAFSILQNVYDSGRVHYIVGMIKNGLACEYQNGNAFIRVGKSGERKVQRMPFYWILYQDKSGDWSTFNFYSYINNIEHYKSPNEESWTAPISINLLLEWVVKGGAALIGE